MIEMPTIHFWSFAGRRVDLYANFHSFPSFGERFVVCLDASNDPNVYKLKNKKIYIQICSHGYVQSLACGPYNNRHERIYQPDRGLLTCNYMICANIHFYPQLHSMNR